MPGFITIDGEIYAATAGAVATTIVAAANKIGELNGAVNFDITWDKVSCRWRRRTIQDMDALRVNGTVTVEEVEFRATALTRLLTPVSTGTGKLYGPTPAATASFVHLRSSTAPRNMQLVFHFRRSDNNKIMQVYCPKVQVDNFPIPFAVDDYVKSNFTFNIIASTNGNFMRVMRQV